MSKKRKGQVTIFIIIAILVVAAVALFFMFRGKVGVETIPKNIEPVYLNFLSCLEQEVNTGILVLESQAGYINTPDFDPGSVYMPFSNKLDFLGNPVPYWYYVSGNNIQKEQVPSMGTLESELGSFVEDRINSCRFDEFYNQGFTVEMREPKAKVNIIESSVEVVLDMDLDIIHDEGSAKVTEHRIVVDSYLGELYNNAKKVYEKEQSELFLEKYAVDNLRLYAPVDGVELTCSPKIWNADDVFGDLEQAIEDNTITLKLNGASDDYFSVDMPISSGIEVRFLNSKEWPHGFEVNPSEGNSPILMANPIGNQPGLGILGFCYAPYHFVYNVQYPVLIQLQKGDEIFQFPIAVVLLGNNPRKALETSAAGSEISEFCNYKNTLTEINVYDSNLRKVDAEISFECAGTRCLIGKTTSGYLKEQFPQCVNGKIIVKADGFEEEKIIHSTTQEANVDAVLDKIYSKNIRLTIDNKPYSGMAVISFLSNGTSSTVVYPEQTSVELTEGQYNVQVYTYKDSSIQLAAETTQQCVEVPKSGVIGIFGLTEKKCFDIDIPSQIVSQALSGGGKEPYYVLESELVSSGNIEINADSLPSPDNIEQLQNNYILFEQKDLDIVFR